MAKITGRVEVLVNGQPVLNKNGATAIGVGLSGQAPFERTSVMGMNGVHGFVETPVEAACEVTITDRDDTNLDDYAQINGTGTLIFRTANGGKEYTLNNITCTNNLTITAGEGETPLRFIGDYWVETTSTT